LTRGAEPPAARRKDWQKLAGLLALYAAVLLLLTPRLALWLDEILGLIGVRFAHAGALLDYLSNMPGGVPLAYFTQWAVVKLLGYSIYSARLTSILCSLAACVGIFLLARRLPIRRPLFTVLVYCLLPLQLRYALEARPYGVALCFSVWTTVFFLLLLERASPLRIFGYAFCITAGLYSQPYTYFVPLAHFVWVLVYRKRLGWKLTALVAGVMTFSAAAFLPWYLYARLVWQQTAVSYHSHIDWKSALLILHELTGAGYWGSLIVFTACLAGIRRGLVNGEQRLFWSLYLLAPLAGAIAGDLFFGYFVAIRQVLFLVAPMAILSVLGVESRPQSGAPLNVLLAGAILLATLVAGDIAFLRRPRENWQAAAKALAEAAGQGACLIFVPQSPDLYKFFEPELPDWTCTPERLRQVPEVDVAVNPYDASDAPAVFGKLAEAGFVRVSVRNPQKPQIYVYRRRQ
jgi:4-amino-4-deoxy-L-arabinose transferase-like glycosyltransferase